MNLSDIINADILDEAFKHPALKIRTSRKTGETFKPDMDVALKAVLSIIEEQVISTIAVKAATAIQDEYTMYSEMMQETVEPALGDEWQTWWDTLVESAIEPFVPVLSQDWLGKNLIDVPENTKEFTHKLGREYFKQLNYGKTPAQIMSSAGITKLAVEERLTTHNNPTEKENNEMATEIDKELQDVVNTIAAHVGKDYDIMNVFNDLDLASDDDDILAHGAAARLGLDETGVEVLRGERLMHGDDAPDILNKLIQDATQAKKGKKPAGKPVAEKAPALPPTTNNPPKQTAAQKKAEAKAQKAEDAAAEKEGELTPAVLQALKEAGAADADMAKAMGVSRATYNNYVNGKTALSPTAEQYNYIRELIVTKLNTLHEALAALDGTDEAHVVF